MSTSSIDYEAVIADLEAKKAHIESMIAGLRVIAGLGGLGGTPTLKRTQGPVQNT
jgi:hypothetical protein